MKRFLSLDTSIFVNSGARFVCLAALATIQSLEHLVRILLCAKYRIFPVRYFIVARGLYGSNTSFHITS